MWEKYTIYDAGRESMVHDADDLELDIIVLVWTLYPAAVYICRFKSAMLE